MKIDECYSSANPTVWATSVKKSAKDSKIYLLFYGGWVFWQKRNVKKPQIWLIYVFAMICHIFKTFLFHGHPHF